MRPERPGKTMVPALDAGDLRSRPRRRYADGAQPADRDRGQRRGGLERRSRRRARASGRGGPSRTSSRGTSGRSTRAAASRGERGVGLPPQRGLRRHRRDAAAGAGGCWRCSGGCASGSGATRAGRGSGACARWRGERLRTAEAHRDAGRAGDFYLEIDRVLREALSERLGTELGGLRLDELGALLRARGLPDGETRRRGRRLEACDEARFAPGGAAADPAALSAMLARAGELHRRHRAGAARRGGAAREGAGGSISALVARRGAARRAAASARADRRDEAWRRGNEAYLHGDYAGAVAAYEELEHQGVVSADLYFNLGDAYFRKGALGPAIWAFERAAALDPGDEDARYNLAEARKVAARAGARSDRGRGSRSALDPRRDRAGPVDGDLAVRRGLPRLLRAGRRSPPGGRRPAAGARRGRGGAGGGGAAGGGAARRAGPARSPARSAWCSPTRVAVKDGADDNYRTGFEVHAGLRVRLVERDQDWLRVRLGNGLEGWVHAAQIGRL